MDRLLGRNALGEGTVGMDEAGRDFHHGDIAATEGFKNQPPRLLLVGSPDFFRCHLPVAGYGPVEVIRMVTLVEEGDHVAAGFEKLAIAAQSKRREGFF